jgi:hypothetical protein
MPKRLTFAKKFSMMVIMTNKGTIIWKGDFGGRQGNYKRTQVTGFTSDASFDVFVQVMQSMTNSNVSGKVFSQVTTLNDSPPERDSNIDRVAVAYFMSQDSTRVQITLPDPKADFVTTNESGEVLTEAALGFIRFYLNVTTGRGFRTLYSKVVQSE